MPFRRPIVPSRLSYGLMAVALGFLIAAQAITPAGADEIETLFAKSDEASSVKIDHTPWSGLLAAYVKPGADGLNRVDYAAFKNQGRDTLTAYLKTLQKVDVTALNRAEQFAFWANLYNAKTIDIILAHYPVASIRDIDISPGLFSNGPWGKKVVSVKGIDLSLDDIEHKILRGLWREPRVHYAVNCASVGCPNLMTKAFSGAELDAMLNAGARAYINSPRGVSVSGSKVTASKIYSWFEKDFGGTDKTVLAHLIQFADPDLAAKLKAASGIKDYSYDWSLNDSAR